MRFGLSGLLFPHLPLEDAVTSIGELGADCAELIFDIPHFPKFDLSELKKIRKLIDHYGLEISIHGPIWDLNPASWHREVRVLALKYMKRSIDICSALAGEIVVFHPCRCPYPQVGKLLAVAKEWFLDFTSKSVKYAKEHGVKLALENFPNNAEYPYSSPQEMLPLVNRLDGLGITFDIGHAFLNKRWQKIKAPERKIAEEIKLVGEHILHIHLHDNNGSRDEHLLPGDGRINFRPIVKALREASYDRWIMVELHRTETHEPGATGRIGLKRARELFRAGTPPPPW